MKKEVVLIVAIIITSLLLILTALNILSKQPAVSPNIVDVTDPVMSLLGTVEKIEGNTFYVSRSSSEKTEKKIFKITTGKNTVVNGPQLFIPYLLKKQTQPITPKFTIKDIRVGQRANFTANIDLRTLQSFEFDARFINLTSIPNAISGTIQNIENNTCTVSAVPLALGIDPLTPLAEKPYIIEITDATEISRSIPANHVSNPPEVKKYEVTDLGKGMRVFVYTDVDITAVTSFKALRIEPSI